VLAGARRDLFSICNYMVIERSDTGGTVRC